MQKPENSDRSIVEVCASYAFDQAGRDVRNQVDEGDDCANRSLASEG